MFNYWKIFEMFLIDLENYFIDTINSQRHYGTHLITNPVFC